MKHTPFPEGAASETAVTTKQASKKEKGFHSSAYDSSHSLLLLHTESLLLNLPPLFLFSPQSLLLLPPAPLLLLQLTRPFLLLLAPLLLFLPPATYKRTSHIKPLKHKTTFCTFTCKCTDKRGLSTFLLNHILFFSSTLEHTGIHTHT